MGHGVCMMTRGYDMINMVHLLLFLTCHHFNEDKMLCKHLNRNSTEIRARIDIMTAGHVYLRRATRSSTASSRSARYARCRSQSRNISRETCNQSLSGRAESCLFPTRFPLHIHIYYTTLFEPAGPDRLLARYRAGSQRWSSSSSRY